MCQSRPWSGKKYGNMSRGGYIGEIRYNKMDVLVK